MLDRPINSYPDNVISLSEARLRRARSQRVLPQDPAVVGHLSWAEYSSDQPTTLLNKYRGKVRTTLEDTSFLWEQFQHDKYSQVVPHIVFEPSEFMEVVTVDEQLSPEFSAGQIILRFVVQDQHRRWKFEVIELSVAEFSRTLSIAPPVPMTGRLPRPNDTHERHQILFEALERLNADLAEEPGRRTPAVDRLLLASLDNPQVLRYPYLPIRSVT